MIFGVLSFRGIGMASQNRGIIYTSRRPILFPWASGKISGIQRGDGLPGPPQI